MRLRPRLGEILARMFVLGVGATQAGCCCPADDPHVEVDVDRMTPELAALIDRCTASPDDCVELCRAALVQELGDDARLYEVLECEVTPRTDGAHVYAAYYDGSACGRAPEGLIACATDHREAVGRWLVRAAYLEAASVVAFVHLAADLASLGAPRALIAGALAAARDEVRHAAVLRALAGDARIPPPRVAAYRRASLRDLALHNVVEGCARETVGAAVNLWQATAARDPEIRAAFAGIARDECAHAALAWAIHAWAVPQLDDAGVVIAAHHAALANLAERGIDASTRAVLGLPTAREQRAIARAFAMR